MNDLSPPPAWSHSSAAPVRVQPDIVVRTLGLCDYLSTLRDMRAFTEARTADTPDEIWLLQHPPVYTLGQAGKREHLLRETAIPLIATERGGQITYHGPGQVIAYLMIDLRRRDIKVREFVYAMESAVIRTLAAYNRSGERKPGAPGIYVQHEGAQQKISALGLKVRNGCTFHGISLNVAMDLEPFSWINPCGYEGLQTIDLAGLGVQESLEEIAITLAEMLTAQITGKEKS